LKTLTDLLGVINVRFAAQLTVLRT
jgi:hypothetical protein